MNVQEWIAKSRQEIMEGAKNLPSIGSPTAELRDLIIELTYACNLKCRMCNVWDTYRREPSMTRREMSVEELVDYIDESRILKDLRSLIISGGEPFLKKDIASLCKHLLQRFPNVSIGVLTNLYNKNLTVQKLRELSGYLNRVWIGTSLDGLGELHDNTRGVQDAFDHFSATLTAIRKEFSQLPVTINYTLTTDNYKGIYEAHTFCKTMNLDLSVQFPVTWDGAESFSFSTEQLDEIDELLRKMIADAINDHEKGKMDERGLMAKVFYLSGLVDYQRNPRRVFDRCIAGRRFVTLSPEGKVYFCPCLKHQLIGDLREKPFDEIWLGKEATALRRKIDQKFCHCWLNCTIYPNASEALEDKKTVRAESHTFLQRIWQQRNFLRG